MEAISEVRNGKATISSAARKYSVGAVDKYSIDESMVAYFGNNSSKQYIANKPIRVSYSSRGNKTTLN